MVDQAEGEAGVSGDMDKLRGRMLARRKRSRLRTTTISSFTLRLLSGSGVVDVGGGAGGHLV